MQNLKPFTQLVRRDTYTLNCTVSADMTTVVQSGVSASIFEAALFLFIVMPDGKCIGICMFRHPVECNCLSAGQIVCLVSLQNLTPQENRVQNLIDLCRYFLFS